jgi:hypothetical protein
MASFAGGLPLVAEIQPLPHLLLVELFRAFEEQISRFFPHGLKL